MLLRLPANAEEIEELDALKGFATDTPTLDAFTLPHGSHIQVTPSGISATSATTWSPPSKIAVSTHLGEHLLLGLEGAKLALVQATHNESSLQQLA